MNTFPKDFLANRAGMRWIGDVHGSLEVDHVINSALMENYAIGFVGDLTDQSSTDMSGSANDSAHVLRRVFRLHATGHAIMTPGNHCAKLFRYFSKLTEGRGEEKTIKTSHGLSQTIEEIMTSEDRDALISGIVNTIGDASLWHRGGQHVFVHAGAVPGMFSEQPPTLREALRQKSGLMHRALYGQTDGSKNERGFPIRRYDWVDTLRNGETVVIGHDIRQDITEVVGAQGGKLIHIDTGAGKSGRLSYIDFKIEDLID